MMRPTTSVRALVVALGATALIGLSIPHAAATSDPLWTRQYGPVQIGAPAAWAKSTGKGVMVAVIDSGVDTHHPDLVANYLPAPYSHDFACNDDDPNDDSTEVDGHNNSVKGHGTHVTGIVAAVANNGIGVAGVAPDVKVMVEKVFSSGPGCQAGGLTGLTGLAPMAINYAVDHGAKVINLSLEERALTSSLTGNIQTACNNAFAKGTLCVVAAGNGGETKPSGFDPDFNGMVVTANDSLGVHAVFGQKADTKWGVSAPGVQITSTWPTSDASHDGYNTIDGTSMASPHVAGAAAVLFGMGMDAKTVAETLTRTAGPPRDSNVEGAGIIHLDRAAGVESPPTTTASNGAGTNTPVTRAGRSGVGGGSAAVPVTTTSPPTTRRTGAAFESGISDTDSSKDFGALRLKEASKNAANKPFNAAGPLIGLTALASLVMVAVAIPRLRSKDTPLT